MRAKAVYLLYHVHEISTDEKDTKLIGVYSSRKAAEEAQARSSKLPGFKKHPDGFIIDRYVLNQDEWTSGFVTVRNQK
ncbi:DUF7336 domain-containing protein [Geminisphaera colitermitum]|uniref:DUF7336 domain-containing protein n=1 Tax=Geminisphaera colitermitum TaxID=1148786 RepID=UPI000196543F|nr:hypothetical protein [Geminisphaera colitermitum]